MTNRFVIFASYGNDSCALIQWAREWDLEGVAVVYSDIGWATEGWEKRVLEKEEWVRSLGLAPYRTNAIGFRQLARDKKGIPDAALPVVLLYPQDRAWHALARRERPTQKRYLHRRRDGMKLPTR
ncbi:hypothetical protein OZ411_34680 [Bradyrhizobium sp. Arg237L]|uniref:hypothetical protein n=1 Tax=Bradyrhizobium sp. Arg237L TaxID=3003352 RepID=UPI00249E0ED2|nr:hypothetical protein [Bradyrhizobium sp. Arg237L]MDI4237959.1 hypothetical protein [Bradyrhizobium sp. Arg237L]